MKYLVLVIFIFFTSVHADDIQRVNSMLKSIKKLRNDYENVLKKLEACKLKLKNKQKVYAHSFRLSKNAIIYDKIDGKGILNWKKGTSFTSNKRTNKWIKITGYFVNKIWRKSKNSMWIETSNATLRE